MITRNIAMLCILDFTSALWQGFSQKSETEFNYSTAPRSPSMKVFYFRQRLDHFNSDYREWPQKYVVTVQFYKITGPAFLCVGDEGSLPDGSEFHYNALAYAKYLNAIVFSLEHRFYGRILPINGTFEYLNSAQVLADIANFIKGVSKQFHLPKPIKWILFGCSYAGALVAWARLKYPHLIYGAVASSAVILAKVDYYEFGLIVEDSINSFDSRCGKRITEVFEEIKNLLDSPQFMKKISQMFYLHDDQSKYSLHDDQSKYAIRDIIYKAIGMIETAVQYNDVREYPIDISLLCRIMIESNGTKLEALSQLRKIAIKNEEKGSQDLIFQLEALSQLRKIAIKNEEKGSQHQNSGIIDKAWTYQQCSEFGYFSSNTNSTFLSSVKHLLASIEEVIRYYCAPFFSPDFSIEDLAEKINYTNSQYGGLDYNINNVIFIHGSLDPWYKAGLWKTTNTSLYETIFIKGVSHCTDAKEPTDTDIPELQIARKNIFQTLQNWLKTNST